MKGQFATRVCGSPDLYEPDGRGPCQSIYFITAHDGFTLRGFGLVKHGEKIVKPCPFRGNFAETCALPGILKLYKIARLENQDTETIRN
jgi:hypothetical protein